MSAELAVLDAGQGDVTRVAGQVVTGIGFVCAAFIFRERSSLRGVSTAVSLFMCGAIGITLGSISGLDFWAMDFWALDF